MASSLVVNRFAFFAFRETKKTVSKLHSSSLSASFRGCKSNYRFARNCSVSSADAFIVADDDKYGNKQIISVTPRLYDYMLCNVREPEVSSIPFFCFQQLITLKTPSFSFSFFLYCVACFSDSAATSGGDCWYARLPDAGTI
jgi:hypothetical protein